MRWWEDNKEAYESTRIDQVDPQEAMKALDAWLLTLEAQPVFVAYPAGFDFTHVYWYLHKFLGYCRFGFQALDLKSYACAVLDRQFKKSIKNKMPKKWFEGLPPHTHDALDDAREQGMLFFNMRKHRAEMGL
jgi:hypothetical protein